MRPVSKKFKSNKRKEKYLFILISDINLTANQLKKKMQEYF